MDAQKIFKPDIEQQPYYIIMHAIRESQRHHKQITINIDGIELTVNEESDLRSTWDLFVRLLVPKLNKRSEEIWEKIQKHTEKN